MQNRFAVNILAILVIGTVVVNRLFSQAIQFENTIYDFGIIGQQEIIQHIYKFRNDGDAELIVERVRTSCGCTAALSSADKIPPTGNGSIEVTFESGLFKGSKTKNIYVHSNDPDKPVVLLRITGIIQQEIDVNPPLIDFGKVIRGEKVTKGVEILLLTGETTLDIVRIEPSSKFISARVAAKNKKGYFLEAAISPDIAIGGLNKEIRVYTNHTKYSELVIPVKGKIVGEISVTPNVFSFGTVEKGSSATCKLLVQKAHKSDLEILKVESNLNYLITETSSIEKGKKYEIMVMLSSQAPPGRIEGKINIFTSDSVQHILRSSVFGYVRE